MKHFPVMLFGSAYWAGLVEWLRAPSPKSARSTRPTSLLFRVTDDPAEAVRIVVEARAEKPDDAMGRIMTADHVRPVL